MIGSIHTSQALNSECQNSPLLPNFGGNRTLSEGAGESAIPHTGFPRDRAHYIRCIVYMYSEEAGYFDVQSERAFNACVFDHIPEVRFQ